MKKTKYYAYVIPSGGRGIVDGWAACEKKESGVSGARDKGFTSREEAEAWLRAGAAYEIRPPRVRAKLKKGIYFDAGTGRGDGVEISVTDEKGEDLLREAMPKGKINRFGKHLVPGGVTNNYGELLACKYAIRIAKKHKMNRIFGDSKLVLAHWSRGVFKEKNLPKKTVVLIREVAVLRSAFEKSGGKFSHISGADNPADLGFH